MILLTAHSLTPRGRFEVETCGLTLEERNSQIQFTLPVGEAELTTGDWIRDDTDPGAGIVYRIRTVETNYQTRTVSCTAEHIIKVLRDTAIFGEVTPEDMGGTETSVSALAAIKNAINRQSDWVLNEQGFGYGSVSAGYTFNGDSVYEAIETVCSTLEDCWWSYDVSVYPFVLTIAHKATTATCEMRGGRNISSIRRTVDRSRMYTRIYPIGKENLHITGNYLSKNTNIYGVICKVETDQSIESEDHLRMWAQGRLNRHCEPSVNTSINGLELSQETGEPLDHLTVGTVCRVPLPEFGTTLNETITKLQWRDKIKEPENVSVTLSNEMEDVASIIRQEQSSGSGLTGRGGRAGAKKAGEDHAWFVDTDDHVAMVAEAIGGEDENGNPNWSRVSQSVVDGKGIHDRVTYAEGEIVTHESRIDQTESDITQEVTDRSNADGTLQSQITQNAGQIALKVNAGDVATQLAVECGNVSITGGNLTVDGYVTSTGLSTAIASLSTVNVIGLSASGNINATGAVIGGGVYAKIGGSNVDLAGSISALQIIGPTNNVYTLQYKKHNSSGWESVAQTFSRAVASWTLGWSGGTFTAKANPQNQSATTVISQGTPAWEGTACTIPINGTDSTSPNVTYATGINAYVDAASKLEEITVAGDYAGLELTPSTGKIGFSKVTIGALTEYEQVTVTPQGAAESVYVTGGNGVDYYQAGSAVTYYKGNGTRYKAVTRYLGDGGTVTGRGDSCTRYTAGADKTYYLRNTTALKLKRWGSGTLYPNPSGTGGMNKEWYYVDSGGTSYYTSNGSVNVTLLGDSGTYYKGNGSTVTGRGNTESCLVSDENGAYYTRGDSVSVTPITGTALNLLIGTRYAAGTPNTTDYYRVKQANSGSGT